LQVPLQLLIVIASNQIRKLKKDSPLNHLLHVIEIKLKDVVEDLFPEFSIMRKRMVFPIPIALLMKQMTKKMKQNAKVFTNVSASKSLITASRALTKD